jgi:hypothetical protein
MFDSSHHLYNKYWEWYPPSRRDDIWIVLYFIWRWREKKEKDNSTKSYRILHCDLDNLRKFDCTHQEDLLQHKERFRTRTFPLVTAKTQRLLSCFCIWLERWLNEFGDEHFERDTCLWDNGRPSYYNRNPYEEMDDIEIALKQEDDTEDEW